MKFLADHMLGRLARWLRMFGYDTLYPRALKDNEIIKIVNKENRVLLTRDKTLANSKNTKAILIESVNIEKQLEQVVKEANLKIKNPFSRCTICNYPIIKVEKKDVIKNVPEKVYQYNYEFWKCQNCSKIYWKGSHWEKICEKIKFYRGI